MPSLVSTHRPSFGNLNADYIYFIYIHRLKNKHKIACTGSKINQPADTGSALFLTFIPFPFGYHGNLCFLQVDASFLRTKGFRDGKGKKRKKEKAKQGARKEKDCWKWFQVDKLTSWVIGKQHGKILFLMIFIFFLNARNSSDSQTYDSSSGTCSSCAGPCSDSAMCFFSQHCPPGEALGKEGRVSTASRSKCSWEVSSSCLAPARLPRDGWGWARAATASESIPVVSSPSPLRNHLIRL